MFEGVLDMLSGRYPSDEFAELRPRITWDRVHGTLSRREGAKRVAIANAGTIPDRGLYGVFLAGAIDRSRVGELDEEMVFETPVGETFTLGASTWRIEEITHDRVLVTPAPGEPGKMPFWHGDQAGRPVELGYAIGTLVRELRGDAPRRRPSIGWSASTISTRRRREPAPLSRRSGGRRRRPRRPHARRSSAASTSSATGASACSRRSAAAFMRPGRWPPRRTSAIGPASTSR